MCNIGRCRLVSLLSLSLSLTLWLFPLLYSVMMHALMRSIADGSVSMQSCRSHASANDVRAIWAPQPNGQLKLSAMGSSCLTVVGETSSPDAGVLASAAKVVVRDCADASETMDARDKFFM